ncbi:hypothetical protein FQN60_012625 [Etheostoma spectabile]|uniref:Uncharacterized protein n=1 Tax=Etheostoma spectabile TaxID=54343 RepID=A0A5J5D8J4_9PERO|nr:hypothetical protein FQN60_012625 [Etheostoma spectabile]
MDVANNSGLKAKFQMLQSDF